MSQSKFQPSSVRTGFFQTLPTIPPQYCSDETSVSSDSASTENAVVPRILSLYLPKPLPQEIHESLIKFSRKCLDPETLRLMVNCETDRPTLHLLNTFGEANSSNPLRTSEGWRGLKDIQTKAGAVGLGYSPPPGSRTPTWNRRMHQFTLVHFWSGSSALVTCPAAMTDGAAVLLGRHLDDPDGDQPGRSEVLAEARRRLTSFDPAEAWTSGQWMTERTGGSDVSQTETAARRISKVEASREQSAYGSSEDAIGMPLGPWVVDGFKWFSSATDADMVVLLARTTKGISAFYAPLRRRKNGKSVMNGVRISRLKDKLGTKGLPTAELEIEGMRAWLIGEEGKGVKEISAILNSTRLWTASGAVGGWARGLAIARAYAKVRTAKGKLLVDNKQHVAWLATETVKYNAFAQLSFLGVALLGIAEQGQEAIRGTRAESILPKTASEAELLLRILTPVMKAQCSLAAIAGLRECMESLGGVGYCENNEDGGVMNIARIFRDTNVNAIWEGTTSILAEDLIRALRGKGGHEGLERVDGLVVRLLQASQARFRSACQAVSSKWERFKKLIGEEDMEEVLYRGREMLEHVQDVLCAGLLMFDAVTDDDVIADEVAKRWIELRFGVSDSFAGPRSKTRSGLDKAIFLGSRDSGSIHHSSKL